MDEDIIDEMVDFIKSLENDNGQMPAFMWDWRNEILKTIESE